MRRRLVTAALVAAVAAVLPATAAHARCAGEMYEPRTLVCITTCVVYSTLEPVYC